MAHCSCSTVIHVPVNCSMLAEKLNMAPEEAERWIVNLIRNARLDAKIDSKLVSMCAFITDICNYNRPDNTFLWLLGY